MRQRKSTTGQTRAAEAAVIVLAGALALSPGAAKPQQMKPLARTDSKTIVVAQADTEADPNLPGVASPTGGVTTSSGVDIQWTKIDPHHPTVIFSAPGVQTSHPAQYLGWNDQGSYFRNYDDRQVYVWNLSKGSLTKIGPEVPPETLASLKNNPYAVRKDITPPPPKAPAPEPQTPDTSRQAAFFGNNGKDMAGVLNTQRGHAPPGGADIGSVSGTNAAVTGGVLTFTMSDGSRSKTYKVLRPTVGGNPNPTAGITGTWLDRHDKLIFTIQPDKSVAGKIVPNALVNMLLQTPQQR